MKTSITIDDDRLKFNLNINQTLIFTKRCSLYKILVFKHFQSGALGDIEGFIHMIPGSNKSDKPVNLTGLI